MNLCKLLLSLFENVGSLVCHQIPERSLWIGGRHLPVCARDTGAYLGFYLGYAIIPLRNRRATGPPNLWITLVMMMPLGVDGITQLFGYRISTNELRLITGLLFGASMTPLLVYLLSLLSPVKQIRSIKKILPIQTELDNFENPWMGYRAFIIVLALVTITFFGVRAITGSNNSIFYWLTSSLTVISIIGHIFILPIFVLGSIALMKRS